MDRHRIATIGTVSHSGTELSLGYEREDFDFGYENYDDIYPNLESFQTALENSRKNDDYFLNGNLLMFVQSPYIQYSPFEYESWGKLYEEAIECYKKSKKPIYSAEAVLLFCEYREDPETKSEQNELSELLLNALSIFEKENHKAGIFSVARLMRSFDFLSYELEKLERKYGVEFRKINYRESLSWNYFLSKLSILPLAFGFFSEYVGIDVIIWFVLAGVVSIILIIVDLILLRKQKKVMMEPYKRFFDWMDE